MKYLLALAAFFMMSTTTIHAQNIIKKYETSTDSINGRVVYRGLIDFKILDDEATFDWYDKGTKKYKPKKREINTLKKELSKYSIIVVMGTWCGDSRDMIPKLHNVLVQSGYPMDKLVMYGVDRSKTVGHGQEKPYDIKFVPTIILFDGAKEIGRIVETVNKSVEADLAAIISKYNQSK